MSNHFSADNLKLPGDDRRLDLTDVFAFTAPHDPDTTVLIIDSNPTSAPPPIPAGGDRPGVLPWRGLPDQHRHRRRRPRRRRVHVRILRVRGRPTNRDRLVRHRTRGPPARARRRGPRPGHPRSASTAPPASFWPAVSGCSPGCAATRSSPTSRVPCTGSSGLGMTTSPTTTSTPSRWRCPEACSAAR